MGLLLRFFTSSVVWFWIMAGCCPGFLAAQDVMLSFDLINEDDGMRNSYVEDVIVDSRGLVWMATEGGLHSYDGYSFTVYDDSPESPVKLSSHRINSLAEDQSGNIWMGTDNGINVLDPSTQTVRIYFNIGNSAFPARNDPGGVCRVLKDRNNAIWMIESGYLAAFQEDQLQYFHTDKIEGIVDIHMDEKNCLFLKGAGLATTVFRDGEILASIPFVLIGTDTMNILGPTVYNNEEGHLRSLHFSRKTYTFDKDKMDVVEIVPEKNALEDILQRLLANSFDLNFNVLGQTSGNIVYKIMKVLHSEEGMYWIATNAGVFKLIKNKKVFQSVEGLNNVSLRGMLEHENGDLYMGAYHPFYFFRIRPSDDPEIEQYEYTNIFSIAKLNKDTLIMTSDGPFVYLFDTNKQRFVYRSHYYHMLQYLRSILVMPDGDVLFGTARNGLFIAPEGDLEAFHPFHLVENDSLLLQLGVNCMVLDTDSSFWVGANNGLFYIDWAATKVRQLPLFNDSTKEASPYEVYHIHRDSSGCLWLATNSGLVSYEVATNHTRTYTMRDGLPDNKVYTIQPENDEVLWLSTNNGLSRFDLTNQIFNTFTEGDGISYREFNRNSSLRTKNGQLYFGGLNGFTTFHPAQINKEEVAFVPYISSYAKFDEKRAATIELVPQKGNDQEIILDPANRNITFTLGLTDYRNPSKASFNVMLEGFNDDWQILGNKRVVQYTNLDAGKYTFRVKAANHEGRWSEQEAYVRLLVKEPFFTSKWFYGLLVLIVVGGISSFYLSRLAYERETNKLRNRIANDLHDEVSNTLNNIRIIAMESQRSQLTIPQPDIQRIEQLSSTAIEHVEDVIWAIDQEKKSIKYLLFRMEDTIDELLRSQKIPVTFHKVNLNEETELDFLHRRNLLLIFKEAVSNIIKHTYPVEVVINLGNDNGQFGLSVVNYFTTIKETTYKTGRGTYSMKQRAKALNGKLKVEQQEGRYEVQMKLNRAL